MFKIIHERDKCIGCEMCVVLCSGHWKMAKDNKSNLKSASVNPDTGNYELELKDVGCNQEVTDVCPAQCVIILKK